MKRIKDLSPYVNVLPYASEIFGVYQPLLGWRSQKIQARIALAFASDMIQVQRAFLSNFDGGFELALKPDRSLDKVFVQPAVLQTSGKRDAQSFVMESVAATLPPLEQYDDGVWERALQPNTLSAVLAKAADQGTQWYRKSAVQPTAAGGVSRDGKLAALATQLQQESTLSGYLLYLKSTGQFSALKKLFYNQSALPDAAQMLTFTNPLDAIDPLKEIDRVTLSPIGIVHLFRQYFFELDTFLGPPVSHVWLSPGATVELIEVTTRKEVVERTTEQALETRAQSESSTTNQDELSDAVKDENRSDTKVGMNANVHQGWIGGSADASTSIDLNKTQSVARESTHKRMRSQTEKLSTDIRKNFKSTFKTVTEVTDTSSKRYVLSNTTAELVNYELRRKMRQVAVQVQDIGTYLCWQTYVDDPGSQLGISQLVHLAKDPAGIDTPPPEATPYPANITTSGTLSIPLQPTGDEDGEFNDPYVEGVDVNDTDNTIQIDFGPIPAECGTAGYAFDDTIEWDLSGADVSLSVTKVTETSPGKIQFWVHVSSINFHGNAPVSVKFTVHWAPTKENLAAVDKQNQDAVSKFNEKTKREFHKAFIDSARERIKLASKIEARKFEDLREEERIVVYRSLIQDMLTKGVPMPDDRTRHAVAELLNSIFDIDKMLYFVAPEWWRPRLHHSHQNLGGTAKPPIASPNSSNHASPAWAAMPVYAELKADVSSLDITSATEVVHAPPEAIASTDTVAWGGSGGAREDNYYITDESAPAKLGSSLGWLLQLDGDDMRNAFLNAPWVKAVIPIRPGKEHAAVNWLQGVHVEGSDGLGDQYIAPPDELAAIPHAGPVVTIGDAIDHLCDEVAKKHEAETQVGLYPGKDQEINDDNRVSATPVEKVYEHGFYPLQGGFRINVGEGFEVFDQWVEVLPTDQSVPVEVKYDPKTGRQL